MTNYGTLAMLLNVSPGLPTPIFPIFAAASLNDWEETLLT